LPAGFPEVSELHRVNRGTGSLLLVELRQFGLGLIALLRHLANPSLDLRDHVVGNGDYPHLGPAQRRFQFGDATQQGLAGRLPVPLAFAGTLLSLGGQPLKRAVGKQRRR
jgi:hypothetical protein